MHSLACKLAIWLYVHSSDNSKASLEIYIYGFELLLSTFMGCISIFLISFLIDQILSSLIFLLIFCPLRGYSGGYHSSTYLRCLFSSTFLYLIVVTTSIHLANTFPIYFSLLFSALATLLIFLFAPMTHPNHPISHQRYIRSKFISRCFAIVLFFLICILILIHTHANIIFLISLSKLAVAILMIIPKIFFRR